MINLHAIYYRNIGPFEDKECSLVFEQGKFLIKAPIGSGKSFLFFDGPSYALYRTANRNMLNINSKEGEINLIFSVDEQYYLVKRMLKPGKSKDSCSSQLFQMSLNEVSIDEILTRSSQGPLVRDTNIITELTTSSTIHLEEIVMKNETYLQQSLDQLLPPKPVFLSTMFLLQDAENIFEMQPADRLIVLKNVFGLLGIDEAKEQVQDKKREISYKLKALQDQSQQDHKLRQYLQGLLECYHSLQNHPLLREEISKADDFFLEIEGFVSQLSLNDFSLHGLDQSIFTKSLEILQLKEKELLRMKTSREHLLKQVQDLAVNIKQQEQEQHKSGEALKAVEASIARIDIKRVELLKQGKAKLYEQQAQLEGGLSFEGFSDFSKQGALQELLSEHSVGSLEEAVACIQFLISTGKELQFSIEQAQLKIKNLTLEKEKVELEHRTSISQLKEQQKHYGEQWEQAKKRLEQFSGDIQAQSVFSCGEIGKNCPFITVINKQHFDQLEQQKSLLQQEVSQRATKIEQEHFEEKLQQLEQRSIGGTFSGEELQKEIEEKSKTTEQIKAFLKEIRFNVWEEKLAAQQALKQQISLKDQEIMKEETELQQLQTYQQQKSALESSLVNYQNNIEVFKAQGTEIKHSLQQLEGALAEQSGTDIAQALQHNQEALQYLHSLEQLIQDATSTKHLIKDLQQQEKMLANLYTILSKEMLLFALDEYLPVLSEIINSFLSQVVEYQISMKISETTDKLELEAKVYDEKGEREVKSLSGGQRTILKLVRMLAISSYLNTPLLFLDETINNLDGDTVGKVSEMINSFVKQRTMKFYTVTHNVEIQEMDIWDRVIEVGK